MSATTAPTMSAAALDHARWALLNELASMLEMAQGEVIEMRDSGEKKWPDEDFRGLVNWINLTMEALDSMAPPRGVV